MRKYDVNAMHGAIKGYFSKAAAVTMFDVLKEAHSLDFIERVEHFGRYTASVIIKPKWIWEKARERVVDCPMVRWQIGGRQFCVVLPVTFDANARPDYPAMMDVLHSMVRKTTR